MPTQHGKYRCTAKEGVTTPFLAFEPLGEELRAIEEKLLSVELRPGTTWKQAQLLAQQLNRRMVGLALT
jgi:hypothetical protein